MSLDIEHQLNEKQRHWILARAGKRVLRPGDRELTKRLLKRHECRSHSGIKTGQ